MATPLRDTYGAHAAMTVSAHASAPISQLTTIPFEIQEMMASIHTKVAAPAVTPTANEYRPHISSSAIAILTREPES